MAVEAGIGGAVKSGAATLANLNKWTVSAKGNLVKTTPFQAPGAWEINTPTTKSWTATCDGWLDPADSTGQVTLLNGVNSSFTVEFDTDATHHWSGTALLSALDPSSDASNVNLVKMTFTGSGALTYA